MRVLLALLAVALCALQLSLADTLNFVSKNLYDVSSGPVAGIEPFRPTILVASTSEEGHVQQLRQNSLQLRHRLELVVDSINYQKRQRGSAAPGALSHLPAGHILIFGPCTRRGGSGGEGAWAPHPHFRGGNTCMSSTSYISHGCRMHRVSSQGCNSTGTFPMQAGHMNTRLMILSCGIQS